MFHQLSFLYFQGWTVKVSIEEATNQAPISENNNNEADEIIEEPNTDEISELNLYERNEMNTDENENEEITPTPSSTKEELKINEGAVSTSVYRQYLLKGIGWFSCLLTASSFILVQVEYS